MWMSDWPLFLGEPDSTLVGLSRKVSTRPHPLCSMVSRLSTDADGIGICLGQQAEARIELEQIIEALQAKISRATLFSPV